MAVGVVHLQLILSPTLTAAVKDVCMFLLIIMVEGSGSRLWPLCSGLMKPDTHLGENARQIEVSDDQTTPLLYS